MCESRRVCLLAVGRGDCMHQISLMSPLMGRGGVRLHCVPLPLHACIDAGPRLTDDLYGLRTSNRQMSRHTLAVFGSPHCR
jgi:hypothetical protein